MPHALYLVLCDLLRFVRNGFRNVDGADTPNPPYVMSLPLSERQHTLKAAPQSVALSSPEIKTLLPMTTAQPTVLVTPTPTPTPAEVVTAVTTPPIVFPGTARLFEPQIMYVLEPAGVPLLISPVLTFDGALATLGYGQAVSVVSYHNQYAHISAQGKRGYVRKDDITPHKADVWPHFMSGVRYEADTKEASQLRTIIHDTFGAGRLLLPLQAGEYILYRLLLDQHTIVWPDVRPREPGRWHEILRGQQYIRSTVSPVTDSVMEWTGEDGLGRLGYVEAVLPDLTIRLTGIGVAEAGEYTEALIPSNVWREWRPVFITVQA
jgi:hypothetical protein